MTETRNGPTLREYFEGLFESHKDLHADHDKAHGREHEFAAEAIKTAAELAKQIKADFGAKVETLERAEIRRTTEESNRLTTAAENKSQDERRISRQQWTIGIVILVSSIVINLVIRLLTAAPTPT